MQCAGRSMAILPPFDTTVDTEKKNSFSKHDNRHSVENFGIYLGGEHGKRQFKDPQKDQHRSDIKNFTHEGEGVETVGKPRFVSTYVDGYVQDGDNMGRRCHSALENSAKGRERINAYRITSTKDTLHRFPHKYTLPNEGEEVRPSLNTVWWHSECGVRRAKSKRYGTTSEGTWQTPGSSKSVEKTEK